MNVDRVRLRLTLGYVGVFALIVVLLLTVTMISFYRELVTQQDELLTQEARNQTRNLLNGENREVLAEGSAEFGWAALDLEGRLTDSDRAAPSLGLPRPDLALKALEKDAVVAENIRGPGGNARAVSMPMREASGEVVGVLQYARSLARVEETVHDTALLLLPLGLGALGLGALGGLYMSGRAVQPMREALERQRSFIADASHELKTPLTLMRANAEVLQRGLQDPDDRELAGDVLAEADRMGAVLSDLLLSARLDAGKLAISRESFDLSEVVSKAVARFCPRADSSNARCAVKAADGLLVRGDATRTGQILAVLLDNALRYTPPGGEISVTARRANKEFVEVAVRDTGPGIPPEHLPHIFERFYRADGARSRESGGTGLGLSIARSLARAQWGDLTAHNAPDGGAVFLLLLPAA
jgi:signal transduction histidine kinase